MPMRTENGWYQVGSDQLDKTPIPGTELVIPLQRGIPSAILKAYAADYHLFVESLYNSRGGTDEGGWTPTNSVATSNHLSGTAMDLNWDDHPFQVRGTFSTSQVETLREILAYYEDTVFWAGDWNSPVDEMHHQMGYSTYQNPHCQDFITRKIRSDGFSFFRKGQDTAAVERKPVVPSDGGTYWADVSQYQGRPVDDTYPYGVFCFRTNSGDKVDTLAAQNATSALEALNSGGSSLVIPYYFFRPGQGNCDLHRQVLQDAGLWLHDNTISMVDVESDAGKIKGDQSWEINDEVNRMRGWYGNQRRVCGYWNPNADAALWQSRPYMLELIIPQYNGRPGDLTGVHDNVAAREAFAHQYTDSATDVAPWSGQGVDLNWTPYSPAELLTLFGMGEEVKEPETGELELSDADIETLCAAIASQFTA
jgi:D-alanyl-D-alanine carboxypeptidase